nr:hypothetical protein [Tanacetum cinerariifolium]
MEGTVTPHIKGPNFLDPSVDVEAVHKEGAILNEPTPQGEGSGSGPGHQETMRGYTVGSGEDKMEHDIELTDPIPPTPHDLPLSGGHTRGSDEGSMILKELMDLYTTLLQKVLDLENVKIAQAKEIASLKKRVTKLEQRQSLRISSFHPFRAGSSKRHSLDRMKVSKQRRKNLKLQKMFQDIKDVLDEDADTEMIVEDKGNGEKRGSITEIVSTARPNISAARPEDSTTKPKTHPTTATLFDDKDVTIADTLIQAHLDKEARTERERQEEASKAALAEMYDEVQAQIDASHELAVRLTHKE